MAQSFGLPIIAPNTGCLPDLVPDSTGFLYDHGDKNHLSKTILLAANSDLEKRGIKARELQLANDWKSIGIKTKTFYGEILKLN